MGNNKIVGNMVGTSRPKTDIIDAYTKTETDEMLDLKVNNEDVYTKTETDEMLNGGCKYMGEVDTFSDLPYIHNFNVIGAPFTGEGGKKQDVGTYNSETGEITFNNSKLPGTGTSVGLILIPVEETLLKEGYYALPKIDFGSITGFTDLEDDKNYLTFEYYLESSIGKKDVKFKNTKSVKLTEKTITHVAIYFENTYSDAVLNGTSAITCSLQKVNVDSKGVECEPLETGHMYKVSDENACYIWTGSSWDALGGSYNDNEGESSQGFEEHKNDTNNPHKVTAEQVGAYTIDEMDNALANKVDMQTMIEFVEIIAPAFEKVNSLSNVYHYKGSVDSVDVLPYVYKLEQIDDVRDDRGQLVGTFDKTTGLTTFISNPPGSSSDGNIVIDFSWIVPIKPFVLKGGLYYYPLEDLGNFDYVNCGYGITKRIPELIENATLVDGLYYLENDVEVDKVELYYDYIGWFAFNGGERILDFNIKCAKSTTALDIRPEIGYVYNTLDTDMNYAWTGTEWDALGGSHIDQEARDDIENLETQMGDVETALDSILEIQNTLIGGDA